MAAGSRFAALGSDSEGEEQKADFFARPTLSADHVEAAVKQRAQQRFGDATTFDLTSALPDIGKDLRGREATVPDFVKTGPRFDFANLGSATDAAASSLAMGATWDFSGLTGQAKDQKVAAEQEVKDAIERRLEQAHKQDDELMTAVRAYKSKRRGKQRRKRAGDLAESRELAGGPRKALPTTKSERRLKKTLAKAITRDDAVARKLGRRSSRAAQRRKAKNAY